MCCQRNEVLLVGIIEGRMKGKAYHGGERLRYLTSSAKCQEVKRTAEDRDGWRATDRRGMP